MPFKTFERFGEISADEITQDLKFKREATNMKILIVSIAMCIGVFLYVGNITVNQFWYVEKVYPWLNRCNLQCQSVLSIHHINKVESCIGLTNLFNEPQQNYPVEWRLLIDDKASYHGCSGFPKTLEEIESVMKQEVVQQIVEKKLDKKAEELREKISNKQQLYADSVNEKTIKGYIKTTAQSGLNPAEMEVTMTPNFSRLQPVKQEQILGILWQKWAVIYDHKNPNIALIRAYDAEGNELGVKQGLESKALSN